LFHLSALRVVDHEGVDLPDLEAARQEAIRTARELAENREHRLAERVIVTDEQL
jgi:hypothetical protein